MKEVGKEDPPSIPFSLGKWGNQAKTGASHHSIPKDTAKCFSYPMRAPQREILL